MKPYIASLINAIILIGLGSWSYFNLEARPLTALIPVIIGVVLLLLNPGIKKENKIVAHIAVLLTLGMLIGLIKPLMGAIGIKSIIEIIKILLMMLSTAFALSTFIRSFMEVRKNRKAEENK